MLAAVQCVFVCVCLQMMKSMCETEQEYFLQQTVHQKLQGYSMPHPKCKGTILVELATELRDELSSFPIGAYTLSQQSSGTGP